MKLLAHRGAWTEPGEKNSLASLVAAVEAGHGVETDIRDLDGRLVISHDMPTREAHVDLDAFLDRVAVTPQAGLLALNIKADGLQAPLSQALRSRGITRWFAFDMSVPDLLGWRRQGLPCAVRLSEYEDGGPLLDDAPFVWLDAFQDDTWYSPALVRELLARGKTVAIVSPELHKRAWAPAWERLAGLDDTSGRLYLCTDLITQAMEVFDV
jgi:hypothetical protein